jgi:hypothetical protein
MRRVLTSWLVMGWGCWLVWVGLAGSPGWGTEPDVGAAGGGSGGVHEQRAVGRGGGECGAGTGTGAQRFQMVATALVLFMTLPGLALFYGGLVRRKNVLSVMAQCLGIAGIGDDPVVDLRLQPGVCQGNPFVGGLDHLFFRT